MKHRRQKRAGADQVSGRNKDGVGGLFAELLDQGREVLGPAGRDRDFLAGIGGVGDPDSTDRRAKVAVEVVDRQDSEFNRRSLSVCG